MLDFTTTEISKENIIQIFATYFTLISSLIYQANLVEIWKHSAYRVQESRVKHSCNNSEGICAKPRFTLLVQNIYSIQLYRSRTPRNRRLNECRNSNIAQC